MGRAITNIRFFPSTFFRADPRDWLVVEDRVNLRRHLQRARQALLRLARIVRFCTSYPRDRLPAGAAPPRRWETYVNPINDFIGNDLFLSAPLIFPTVHCRSCGSISRNDGSALTMVRALLPKKKKKAKPSINDWTTVLLRSRPCPPTP